MDVDSYTLQLLIHYGKVAKDFLSPFKPLFVGGFYLSSFLLLVMVLFQGIVVLKDLVLAILFNVKHNLACFPRLSLFFLLLFLATLCGVLKLIL
ncbi:MAG: hypothetical protein NZT61_02085 [Deltaproteobacteria bacterium]|nr:hypothetical protein [Deltaproteobacteria bacterium]MCX7952840.1 hypothetical protein [Deltaproteobacteria bacterium]